jgi:hypothetical protein
MNHHPTAQRHIPEDFNPQYLEKHTADLEQGPMYSTHSGNESSVSIKRKISYKHEELLTAQGILYSKGLVDLTGFNQLITHNKHIIKDN